MSFPTHVATSGDTGNIAEILTFQNNASDAPLLSRLKGSKYLLVPEQVSSFWL